MVIYFEPHAYIKIGDAVGAGYAIQVITPIRRIDRTENNIAVHQRLKNLLTVGYSLYSPHSGAKSHSIYGLFQGVNLRQPLLGGKLSAVENSVEVFFFNDVVVDQYHLTDTISYEKFNQDAASTRATYNSHGHRSKED